MKTEFILSGPDKNNNKEEIERMIDDISPIIEKFYKEYNATVKKITYDSTADFTKKTEITFDVDAPGFYPGFDIEVSRLGSGYLTPGRRQFDATFYIKGLSSEFKDYIYVEYGINSIIMDNSFLKTPVEKVEHLISKANETLEKWKNYSEAYEIFVF